MLRFLSAEDVLQIHQDTIAIEGGSPGVRDLGLLESAVAMPRQQFDGQYLHEGLAAMAAACLLHLAANHPFIDGNKRTAALTALVFLDLNGVGALPESDALEAATMAVASSLWDKEALTVWFREQPGETHR